MPSGDTNLRQAINPSLGQTTDATKTTASGPGLQSATSGAASAFTISANSLAKAGNRRIYLQITTPDGRILQGKENYVVNTDSGNIPYSDKKDVDYNNENLDVTIYYDLKEGEAVKGNYKIKIICDGQTIGSDSFTLK